MEEFIKDFVKQLGPTFSTMIGGVALASVLIPYLVKAWETWCDAKSGKRALAAERDRLELAKLWLEVEALRKQHDLTLPFPIPPPVMPLPTTPTKIRFGASHGNLTLSSGTSGDYPGVWRWLVALDRRHRALSMAALFLLGTLALPSAVGGLLGVIGLFLTIARTPEDIALVLFMTAAEGLLLVLVRSLHRQYSLLHLARKTAVNPRSTD